MTGTTQILGELSTARCGVKKSLQFTELVKIRTVDLHSTYKNNS